MLVPWIVASAFAAEPPPIEVAEAAPQKPPAKPGAKPGPRPNGPQRPEPKSPWRDHTYVIPRLNLSYVSVNGDGFAQAVGGLEGGLIRRYRKEPHYVWTTRGSALGILGLSSFDLGADLRAGSFIGPDYDFVRLSVGPDLWYNGYGTPDSADYWLPWSAGLSLPGTALWKLGKGVNLDTRVIPGWAFDEDRQTAPIGPFHELTLLGALNVNMDHLHITAGYQRSWNALGKVDTVILSLGI